MNQNLRHQQICQLVKEQGFVSIDDLVEHFGVTPQTIRRDLNKLADDAKISRYHGGAGALSSSSNASYQSRKILNLAEKEKIAQVVSSLVPDYASLFINIGTTTETIARALLHHKGLRVVTNNLHVASILSAKPDFSVIVAAGEVRHKDGGIIGEATCDFISQFRMDFGIIGISGIGLDGNLLDFDFREVKVAQAIIENSQKVILAADHSKFERNAMVRQGNISQVDHFVTDITPPPPILDILQQHQLELHLSK